MIEPDRARLEQVRDNCRRAHDLAMAYIANAIVGEIRIDIGTKYPPASEPGNPPHSRTGRLVEGVSRETSRDGSEVKSTITSERAGGNAAVPSFLERGTSKMRPRPYFTPAREVWAAKGPGVFGQSIRANFSE